MRKTNSTLPRKGHRHAQARRKIQAARRRSNWLIHRHKTPSVSQTEVVKLALTSKAQADEVELKPRQVKAIELGPASETPVPELKAVPDLVKLKPEKKSISKSEVAPFEKREKLRPEHETHEENWTQDSSRTMTWVLIAGSLSIVLVIAALVVKNWVEPPHQKTATPSAPLAPIAEEDVFGDSPEKWFYKNSIRLQREAMETLRAFRNAPSIQEKSRWVRNPELFLKQVGKHPITITANLGDQIDRKWSISHIDNTGYLFLDTLDDEFLPCRVYFTRSEDGVKLDWAASARWSDHPVEQLASMLKNPKTSPSGVYLLRCKISRRDEFYAGPYNDQDHSVFQLISDDGSKYLWGYVQRDSELDLAMRDLLDHGRFVVALKKNLRVTLEVETSQKDALPSQIEVMELLHRDWVSPE